MTNMGKNTLLCLTVYVYNLFLLLLYFKAQRDAFYQNSVLTAQ